ncbi:MAG TPA: wax ester/triacylglycerol synthase family O-acyltransferase [Candidatus Dormibacteraeota bacterium]|nr:wax ester/triacylglycerol synthase family O-acyltransferase [Candidatus Dormibacteraeota bacterium]
MATITGDTLSRADTAWLHAEATTNHFVVTSLALLDSPPSVERLKATLARRIGLLPHLTDVAAEPALPLASPRWSPSTDFDLDAHIHRVALPSPAGVEQLADFIGDLAGRPLDFGRPLWEVYAVDGPGQGGALVGRFHHSLGDGDAMVRMFLTLTDQTPDGWRRSVHGRHGRVPSQDRRSALARVIDGRPSVESVARTAIAGAGTLARLTLLDPDRPTSLRGHLGLLKAVSWTEPISLARVKQIARWSGTTVNDVIVSVVAGGLGSYLRRTGTDTAGLRIRAMVPVNLRPSSDAGLSGNRFSLVYLEMPVGVIDAEERLLRVKREMDRIKGSLEPAAGWLLVQGLGFLPPAVERLASSFYAAKASLVLTNVIGPRQRRYLAGSRIRQMAFWEPESGGLGVGVSIYSYAGAITVGVISDRNLVKKPEQLTSDVMRAFRDLARQQDV